MDMDEKNNVRILRSKSDATLLNLNQISFFSVATPLCKYDNKTVFNWTISDAIDGCNRETSSDKPCINLPLKSFNHIAREVLSLEKSKCFYEGNSESKSTSFFFSMIITKRETWLLFFIHVSTDIIFSILLVHYIDTICIFH